MVTKILIIESMLKKSRFTLWDNSIRIFFLLSLATVSVKKACTSFVVNKGCQKKKLDSWLHPPFLNDTDD